MTETTVVRLWRPIVDVQLTVEADSAVDAIAKAVATLRSAIHAIETDDFQWLPRV